MYFAEKPHLRIALTVCNKMLRYYVCVKRFFKYCFNIDKITIQSYRFITRFVYYKTIAIWST